MTVVNGLKEQRLPVYGLNLETADKYNVGVDLRLWKNFRRVIKAKQRRTGDSYENEDGSSTTEIIETTSNKMVFNLLTPEGVKLLV